MEFMMIRSLIRRAPRVFAFALMVFAAAGPARGVQVSLPVIPVQILGADSLCTSWTLGGTAGAPTLTCVTGGGGPAPFFCSLSGAPVGQVAPGTAVNLQMFCVGGSTPYSYLWTPGNSTAASLSVNPAVTTTYSVTARDNAGATFPLSATVTVSSGGGGGGGTINCAASAIGAVITGSTQVLDLDWNNPLITAHASGLSQGDAVVVRITTGPAGGFGKISGAEFGGTSAGRYTTMSATPCDFRYPPPLGWGAASIGNTVEILFANGDNPYGYPSLAPNTTSYFNLRTTGACGNNCGMLFQLNRY
jgi:hypothetical protein